MSESAKAQIRTHEERLKQAMLLSDISILDELISPELIFTNHLGQVISKQDDLDAHESGILSIDEITLTDQNIKIFSGIAVVSVKAHIIGRFDGVVSESDFRFTRVWSKASSEAWQIVAGHSSIVV